MDPIHPLHLSVKLELILPDIPGTGTTDSLAGTGVANTELSPDILLNTVPVGDERTSDATPVHSSTTSVIWGKTSKELGSI